jgi:hypothetical protein
LRINFEAFGFYPYVFLLCVAKTALAKTAMDEGLVQGCTSRGIQVNRATVLWTVAARIRGPWYGETVKFTPEQVMKTQRVSRIINTLSLTSAVDGGEWSTPRPGRLTPGKYPVPIVQEAGRAPKIVLSGCGKSRHTGIRSPDCRSCHTD